MAAPNLRDPVTVTGKTQPYACTNTLASVLSNGVSSGKVLKINSIRATNITSGSGSVDVTHYRGTTHTYFSKLSSVPANGSLILNDRNEYIYLEEGDALYAKANASSTIELLITYEDVA